MPFDRDLTEEQLQLLEQIVDDAWVLIRRGGISVPKYWVECTAQDAVQPVDSGDVRELQQRDLIALDDRSEPISRFRVTSQGFQLTRDI